MNNLSSSSYHFESNGSQKRIVFDSVTDSVESGQKPGIRVHGKITRIFFKSEKIKDQEGHTIYLNKASLNNFLNRNHVNSNSQDLSTSLFKFLTSKSSKKPDVIFSPAKTFPSGHEQPIAQPYHHQATPPLPSRPDINLSKPVLIQKSPQIKAVNEFNKKIDQLVKTLENQGYDKTRLGVDKLLESSNLHDEIITYLSSLKNNPEELKKSVLAFLALHEGDPLTHRGKYMFVRRCLIDYFNQEFPGNNINKYFFEVDKNIFGIYFKREGLKIILDYLKHKGSLPADYQICTFNEGDYKKGNFFNIFEDFLAKKEIQKLAMIVQITGANNEQEESNIAFHYMPVYMEKEGENQVKIFISDSIPLIHLQRLKAGIETYIKTNGHNDVEFKIFSLNEPVARQNDRINCSIFAVRDIVKMAKNSKKLIDSVSKSGQNGHFYFRNLPDMLKVIQSMQEMKEYEQRLKTEGVKTNFRKHVRKNPKGKEINYKVADTHEKYERVIWHRIFQEVEL